MPEQNAGFALFYYIRNGYSKEDILNLDYTEDEYEEAEKTL